MGKCSCGGNGVCPHCGKSTKSEPYRPLSSFSKKDIRRWANSGVSTSSSSSGLSTFFGVLFVFVGLVLLGTGGYQLEQDNWSCESGEVIMGGQVLDEEENCADGSDEVANSQTNQTKSYYDKESTVMKGTRDIILQTCCSGLLFLTIGANFID